MAAVSLGGKDGREGLPPASLAPPPGLNESGRRKTSPALVPVRVSANNPRKGETYSYPPPSIFGFSSGSQERPALRGGASTTGTLPPPSQPAEAGTRGPPRACPQPWPRGLAEGLSIHGEKPRCQRRAGWGAAPPALPAALPTALPPPPRRRQGDAGHVWGAAGEAPAGRSEQTRPR